MRLSFPKQRRSRHGGSRSTSRLRKRLKLELLEDRRLLATFAVNSTAADLDGNPSDGICDTGSNSPDTEPPFIKTGICTLAAASIQADESPSLDIITFGELGGTDSPVLSIGRGVSFLHPVTIDGTTHASGRVVIDGSLAIMDSSTLKGLAIVGHSTELTIGGQGNTVTDTYVGYDASGTGGATDDSGFLRIQGNMNTIGSSEESARNLFAGGININGDENTIIGNYVGVDLSGETASPAPGVVFVDGTLNTLGTAEPGEGNVFAGGIQIVDGSQTKIQGNKIGTNAAGTAAIKPDEGNIGVSLGSSVTDVVIGGAESGEGNLISGLHFGIIAAVGVSEVYIWGNKIGTNADGDAAIPNAEAGIQFGTFHFPTTPNLIEIGGSSPAHGNLISGNSKGIALANIDPSQLRIANNRIGTKLDGTSALANEFGISVENAKNIVIGGEHGNLISGNKHGVLLTGPQTSNVRVLNNRIGTDLTGTSDLGNVTGVRILHGAHDNHIGGRLPGNESGAVLGNVISGSDALFDEQLWGVGVWIIESNDNWIQGNRIGTNASGTAAIGNEGEGILVFQSAGTKIGGDQPGEGNLISGNADGILLWSTDSSKPVQNTEIAGNLIGTNASGTAAIPNTSWGVHLTGPVSDNEIGGSSQAKRNVISGNQLDGIVLFGEETTLNTIHGNYIGTNLTGTTAIPNERSGILVEDSPNNKIGAREGATFSRNVISGNKGNGIVISGNLSTGNSVAANLVGLAADGLVGIGNELSGVFIDEAPSNTIGGEVANDRNVISANKKSGIIIADVLARENKVHQNYVGLNLDGDAALGNLEHGILIDGAPENTIGKIDGSSPIRNIISGNLMHGVMITGASASQNIVHGNYIGLDPTGQRDLGNRMNGVSIIDAKNNRIGNYASPSASAASPMSPAGNIISDNSDSGVFIQGATATGNQVIGNGIGTNHLGTRDSIFGNKENGVHIVGAPDNFIGSHEIQNGFTGGRPLAAIPSSASLPTKLPPNVIVSNILDGVRVEQNTAINNRILGNKLHHNGSQGIDLDHGGILDNDNDELDADAGPNNLQNYPEIVSAFAPPNSSNFVITAEFRSTPESEFLIQTFRNTKRDPSGQGETVVDSQVITTGVDGRKLITVTIPQNAGATSGASHYAMTATDAAGNTSEFSPSVSVAELYVEPFQIELSDIRWEGNKLIWRRTIEICNSGGRDAEDVKVTYRDSAGNDIAPGPPAGMTVLDLPAGNSACTRVPLQWDITSTMKALDGKGTIGLEIEVDVDDAIREENESNNTATPTRSIDIRPRLGTVETEFLPGKFVGGITMNNEVAVEEVDWNGDLPASAGTGSVKRNLHFRAGNASEVREVTTSGLEVWEFDIGNDLLPGSNEILVRATTFDEFASDDWTQNTVLVDTPAWLASNLFNGKEEGDFGKRIALYTQKIGFPGVVTEGFFNIPASELKVAKGDIGPSIGSYELAVAYRSNGDGTITGKAPWSGKIAGRQLLPESQVALAGTVGPLNNTIALKKLEAIWSIAGEKETPRVRLQPPFSMFEVFAVLQGGVSLKAGVEETPSGQLDWQSVQLGFTGGVIGMIGAGHKKLVSVSGGLGVQLRPTFNLSGDPCILHELTGNGVLRAEAAALGFTARYTLNFPDPPLQLAGCGGSGSGSGEGQDSGQDSGEGPEIMLSKNTGGDWFGTLGVSGLPDIRYAYAAPSIAHHADGTKTLVWVDEDPSKADHERLEILSSRYVAGSWQEPIAVTHDSLMDLYPTITALPDGKALAVWTKASSPLDPDNPAPYSNLASYDLFSSVFDPAAGTWSTAVQVTDEGGMDFLPNLTPTSTGAALAYFNDADGDTSLFPNDGKTISNTILLRTYDATSGAWSSPRQIAENVDSSTAPQIVLGDFGDDVDGVAVWNENVSGLSGGERQRVAISRSLTFEPAILLADEPVSGIAATAADPLGGQLIAWVQPEVERGGDPNDLVDQLWISRIENGVFSAPVKLHESVSIGEPSIHADDLGRLHLTWLETARSAVEVSSMTRDADGTWGRPRQVSASSDMPWWLMPWSEGDELKVLHLNRQVVTVDTGGGEGETGRPIGSLVQLENPSLKMSSAILGADLSIGDMWFTDNQGIQIQSPLPGQVVDVNVIVANEGDFAASANAASLSFNGQPVSSDILVGELSPGQTEKLTFSITLPQSPTLAYTLVATADANDSVSERDENNNSQMLTALKPDLAISHIRSSTADDTIRIEAVVTNLGAAPTTEETPLILRLDSLVAGTPLVPDGGIAPIPPLAPGEQVNVQIDIANSLSLLGGIRSAFLILDPETTDSTDLDPNPHGDGVTENNFAGTTLQPTLPTWQNLTNPLDVNDDGIVTPLDVLLIVNDINRHGARPLPTVALPPPYFDVTGDEFVSALDVLQVVNFLNSNRGEAELATDHALLDDFWHDDLEKTEVFGPLLDDPNYAERLRSRESA